VFEAKINAKDAKRVPANTSRNVQKTID